MQPLILDSRPEAALVLADGTVFRGRSCGSSGQSVAEVVFNTSMTGYQEILTDPSYTGQIVTLTYPHIGNVGTNCQDTESGRVYAAGLVIRELSECVSNFRAEKDLQTYLKEAGIPAISDIDTRKLTRILREKGAQAGCLTASAEGPLSDEAIAQALSAARAYPGMVGQDLASKVTTDKAYEWTEGSWSLAGPGGKPGFARPDAFRFHVVAYDFGVKRNILRLMVDRGIRVTVVPAKTPAADVLAMNPDGVFFSNGPGDPEPCTYAIEAARTFMQRRIPLFGICLGHQIMGLAAGARTVKMKFGHHGANHPVVDLATRHVSITSQNHGFAVDKATLPANARATHVSLFDGSLQGFELTDAPAFCFQGHPEASPGPHDIGYLFDRFAKMLEARK